MRRGESVCAVALASAMALALSPAVTAHAEGESYGDTALNISGSEQEEKVETEKEEKPARGGGSSVRRMPQTGVGPDAIILVGCGAATMALGMLTGRET